MEKKSVLKGPAIVVADRGYVYVGEITVEDDFCIVEKAMNIRRWGTMAGLGQLSKSGPQPETVLDDYGTVRIPMRAVISIIDTEALKWPSLR
jgi:hypothetical protein